MTDQRPQGYLVDWYAVLGLEHTASAEEIGAAYHTQAKAYHPDRYAHLAKDLAAQAAERFRLSTEAYAILSKPVRRQAYDEEFSAWTGPVSRSGNPVIDLSGARYDPTPLFGPSDTEGRQTIERIALQMAPFDPNTFAIIERMAKERPDDPALSAAYRSELRRRDTHLALRESLLWESLGYRNRPIDAAVAGHLEATNEEISNLRTTAEASSAAYALHLATGAMPALTAGDALPEDRTAATDDHGTAIALWHENALRRFDQVAERVRALSTERQTVINDRFAAIERRYENGSPVDSLHLLLHFTVKEQNLWMAFIIQGTSIVQIESPVVGSLKEEPTPETIAEAIARGCSVLHAVFEEDLNVKDQLHAVLIAHFEQHLPEGDPGEEN